MDEGHGERSGRARRESLPRPAATNPVSIYWAYVMSLSVVHLLALLALDARWFSWSGVILCFSGIYLFGTLGINLCYHRLLTHQGMVVPKWLERSLATLGICCLQDSPARWVAVHRLHHQHSDEQADPHSPLVNFFWGHTGWLFLRNRQHDMTVHYERYCRDILRDRYYFWCERKLHWFWIYVAHAVIIFGLGSLVGVLRASWTAASGAGTTELASIAALQMGMSWLVWGVFMRTVLVWHITWAVNSIGHVWGYRNYETRDTSRNNLFVGWLSNGEGWHNNHHAHQRCAAHGHRWWEFDVTYLTILVLEKLGLAREVVKLSDVTSKTERNDLPQPPHELPAEVTVS